jgi:kumamolisin
VPPEAVEGEIPMPPAPDRVELPGSERGPLAGARRAGPADAGAIADVTVLLRRDARQGRLPSLEEWGREPLRSRSHLTREEYAARYGARDDDIAAVTTFARDHGLRVTLHDRARRSVRLEGTVGALSAAFGVELGRYEHPSGTFRVRLGALHVPREWSDRVVGVFGLDDRPQAKTHLRPRPASASGAPSYTPLELAAAYSFPAGATGTGQCIGLIELGGGYAPADLTEYFQGLGLSAPPVTAVSVDGGSNAPTGSVSGPDAEVELDIEVAGSVAPGAPIAVYFAPNTDQGFIDAVSSAVHDTVNRPTVISISWGGPESTWTAQARAAFESIFEEAAALGVTILVAAGDDGADDGGPGTGLSVDYPAASAGVVGCGGTHLVLSGGTISSETVWNDLSSGEGATGGGVSGDVARPSYQSGAHVPSAPNGFVGRGVPDVAGDADPTTGYRVLVDGSATVLGGTSAVAPLWAALIARINQELGKPVGPVNPVLYGPAASATFRAIVSGGNGGYTAGPGWNPCAGLGSPNGTALLRAMGGA